MLFFELLQIAIGNRKMLSHTPTAEEWRELYTLAKKQTMVGIAFCGVEKLPVEQRPQRVMLLQWCTAAERIKSLNEEMDRKTLAVANKFLEEGFPGVVLKGQGIAKLYQLSNYEDGPHPSPLQRERGLGLPDEVLSLTQNSQSTQNIISSQDKQSDLDLNSQNLLTSPLASYSFGELKLSSSQPTLSHRVGASLACGHPDGTVDRRPLTVDTCLDSKQVERSSISNYRTPGDIDIWLHGERDEILEYVRRHVPDCKPVYHHVDFPVLDDVSIEVHFTPTWMNSPMRNRCLQRFFKSMVNSQQSTDGLFNQHDKHTNLDASTHTQACAGHPDEGFGLTQKSQKNIVSQDKQSTLDENSQNLQVASPLLASGVGSQTHADRRGMKASVATAEGLSSHISSQHDKHANLDALTHTQACAGQDSQRLNDNVNDNHDGIYTTSPLQGTPPNLGGEINCPDGSTVDRRPLTVDSNSLTVDTCLDSKQATLPVPNAAFNRVYILVHIYRHLFAEGVGLRQLLDYYFVLQQGFTEVEREETLRTLRSLGMMRFTRAVMWVLQEVYAMPDRYLLTSPDAKEGRFLLDEIMLAGNFGKYDERMQRAAGEGTFRWGVRKVLRNFRFVRSYPSEVLWSPIFKVWHLFWRGKHLKCLRHGESCGAAVKVASQR